MIENDAYIKQGSFTKTLTGGLSPTGIRN